MKTTKNGFASVIQNRGHHTNSNSSRHAISTRWQLNPSRQGQHEQHQLSRSSISGSRRATTCQQTWLIPTIQQQRRYSTRVAGTTRHHSRKLRSAEDIATDREMVLAAALEQSSASTVHSLLDIMFQALRQVKNPKLAWECYTDLTSRNMQHCLTRDQYRDLIRLFNHKSNHKQGLEYVLTLADDMAALGYRIGRREKISIMRLLGMNGKLDEMEQVFLDLKEEQMLLVDDDAQKPFNTMFDMYQMHKDVMGPVCVAEKSLDIYGKMIELGVRPSPSATRLLMENVRGGGNGYDLVEAVWSWFWNKVGMNVGGKTVDLEPSLYREMVLYFASAGRAEYALEVNDLMVKKKIKRDVRVGTALIHKVGRSGNIERAMEIFDELTRIDGVEPTIVTFNALIDIHAHKSPEPDIEGASRAYAMLQEYGLKPDIATLGPLIDMFAKKGDTDMVRRLFRDLIGNQNLKPNQHIYSSVIECFLKHDDKVAALQVLKSMRNTRGNSGALANQVTYNLMIRSFIRNNYMKGVLDLIDLMVDAKLRPEPRTFTPLLGLLADQGNVVGANKVVKMMGNIGTRTNVFTNTALLEAHTKAGDLRGAERLFQKMVQKHRLNTQVYNVLMHGYIKKNEMDMVLATYRQMLKSFVGVNEYTYGILMYYFSRRKEPKAVESLLDTMKNNNIEPRVTCWTILMQSYFEAERFEDGFRVYDRMKQAGIKPNYVTYSLLVATCVRSGDIELAESIVANAIDRQEKYKDDSHEALADARIVASSEAYTSNLPTLVDDLLKKRKEQQLPESKLPPHLFAPLISAYTDRLQFTEAKRIFRQMRDLNVVVSTAVYVSLMKMYQKEERLDIVEQMWQHLRTRETDAVHMADLDPEIGSSIPLPIAVKDYSDLLFARDDKAITTPLQLSPSETSDTVSPFAVSLYIDTLAEQGRFDAIEQLWAELTAEQYPFDDHNWNRYLASLAEAGRAEQASAMAQKYFIEQQEHAPQYTRSGDSLATIQQERQLHKRTIEALAKVLDIDADSLTDRQLYDAVLGTLEEPLHVN
ncbi:hypothetical protein BDB00DRAFT_797851 [Zychaea mexicana]|uniref:uncharacterized protein n=1 Tax=Zychaea mexicana TaxID=64656 RepID=UPI0022FDE1C6|nr:uncharacterized protein BDB00DRAFT_797851 [Zychaea mexicana]KAI9499016.1 hypothetical protein BDB00DRAFT_797851 [Zychaea mexicana]